MGLFNKKAIGIEFVAGEIRFVEMKGSTKAPKITAFYTLPIPDGFIKEGKIKNEVEIIKILSNTWRENKINTRDVMLGISNNGLIIRKTFFPKVPEDKIGKLIQIQAQEYFPVPLSSVVLDYLVVGEVSNDDGNFIEVILIAAKLDMIESFINVINAAGLNIMDIDVTPISLMRIIPQKYNEKTISLINVTADLVNILVIQNNIPKLTRIVPIGSGLEFMNSSVDSNRDYENWILTVVNEIRASINYYQAQENGEYVDTIILSGTNTILDGLVVRLESEFDSVIELHEPLNNITLSCDNVDGFKKGYTSYASSVSLALRGLEE